MLLPEPLDLLSFGMDPASAAGIGLAVMSLAGQCLTGAIQGIQLITSARNLEPEYEYLSLRLQLEQQRLYNWSSEIGLVNHLHEDDCITSRDLTGLSRTTILDTLLKIQTLTTQFIKSKDRYARLVLDESAMCVPESGRERSSTRGLEPIPPTLHFLQKLKVTQGVVQSLPIRLKWAAFNKLRFERLIDKVRALNDVLVDIVDSEARVAIRQSTRETNTTVLHLHNRIDELIQLTKAVRPVEGAGSSPASICATRYGDRSEIQEKRDFASLAYFKAINTSVQTDTYFNPRYPVVEGRAVGDIKLSKSEFSILPCCESGSNRCEADYRPTSRLHRRVWIEWREYDPISLAQPILKPSRIDKLVALLSDPSKPELLRVPHCLGYFDDPRSKENGYRKGRLGFVFEKPTAMDGGPMSLRQLLETESKPPLTERIALVKAVANCLMSLHSVNWLHKGLRSHNIIFFPEEPGERDYIDFSSPYISGFGYARPTFREDMTELPSQTPEHDMYRHPRTHRLGPWEGRQGFKRTFDIYSLGIVMVEIAHWQAIEEVLELGDPTALQDSDLAGIQPQLVEQKKHMDRVGASVGTRFRDATLSCLDSNRGLDVGFLDDETDVQVAAKLSQNFYHKVLRPLEEIVI